MLVSQLGKRSKCAASAAVAKPRTNAAVAAIQASLLGGREKRIRAAMRAKGGAGRSGTAFTQRNAWPTVRSAASAWSQLSFQRGGSHAE
jgi:hypothetical protein